MKNPNSSVENFFKDEFSILNSNNPDNPEIALNFVQKIRNFVKEQTKNSLEIEHYIDRLFNEWTQHGKIIIACDFDDTISPWKLHNFDFDKVIELLKIAKQTGAYIVIFTACNTDRYDEIRKYCESKGLVIDAINETPVELPYGKNGKIYANVFIDDRAGLHEAMHILETAMYRVRGSRQNNIDVA